MKLASLPGGRRLDENGLKAMLHAETGWVGHHIVRLAGLYGVGPYRGHGAEAE